ncbi:hypothetical protein PQ465_11485 [Sphingobacterium oryzagri]|uniref:Lipid A biosynthesis lauroyl acyltransferase n=1 Tax=Sphingobacterium oryzagri TaxID=3025669 RepID=A0ABY7WEX9_9SPHI|nr:hypothetical protein [Sphingobacterium sp. KACC 22765]WDF66928.1 hypothetical protein PQ465_11485 [Sphingobacterium sp. KACC 22765]
MFDHIINKAIWCTNVMQFLPHINHVDLQQAYSSWVNKRRGYNALYSAVTLRAMLESRTENFPTLPSTGGVLLTFHFGPYRMLARQLLASGRKVALLASAKVLSREERWYRSELAAAGMPLENFRCIDASRSMALRSILSAVQSQYWVIHFLDADESSGTSSLHRAKISLFSGMVYWRTNIFKLLARFHLPAAVGCVSSRSPYKPVITSLPKCDQQTEEQFEQDILSVISDVFTNLIASDWTAWENWILLHRYQPVLARPQAIEQGRPIIAMPIMVQDKRYLLDVSNGQFFEIR